MKTIKILSHYTDPNFWEEKGNGIDNYYVVNYDENVIDLKGIQQKTSEMLGDEYALNDSWARSFKDVLVSLQNEGKIISWTTEQILMLDMDNGKFE